MCLRDILGVSFEEDDTSVSEFVGGGYPNSLRATYLMPFSSILSSSLIDMCNSDTSSNLEGLRALFTAVLGYCLHHPGHES